MELKKLTLKPRVFVLCNGELAEPYYFQDFKDHLKAHNILVRYKREFLKKAPWDFIYAAVKFKKEEESRKHFFLEDGDQMWCVFDVDNYWEDNNEEFRKALKFAEENVLKIAWSNECFEFWFLCYFGFYNSAIPRSDYHKKLEKHFKDQSLGTYTKNMKDIFTHLSPYQETAIKNAKRLYKKGAVGNNPSTAVHLVAEELQRIFG